MWTEFALALLVFFASHALPIRPPIKPWLVARLGAGGFTLAYSLLSLVILVWLVVAAGRAPFVPLWGWSLGRVMIALGLMMAACMVLAFAFLRPNPLSFGGWRNTDFDPAHPGLLRLTRHPFLAALALWGGAHLLANGDLAHVILFGVFTGFALLGGRLIDRRKRREMGADWHDTVAQIVAGPILPRGRPRHETFVRLIAGLLLFMVLVSLHPYVIGVAPLAW